MGSGKKKFKKPGASVGAHLRAHDAPTKNTNDLRPHFSFEYLVGPYCVTRCGTEQQADFVIAMHKRSTMSWQQLAQAHRHGMGWEIISHDSIRSALPTEFTPDETLLAFRFSGKAPMVGVRRDRVFYVLWLDRDFSLYDHG